MVFYIATDAIYLQLNAEIFYDESFAAYWFSNVVLILLNVLQVVTLGMLLAASGRLSGSVNQYRTRRTKNLGRAEVY